MELTKLNVEALPAEVREWCEAHSVSTTTSFVEYLEYIDGEIVGRTFATRIKKKIVQITEVGRRETGSNNHVVRNLLVSGWGGYRAVYKTEDVIYRGGGYPYKVFSKTDFNVWANLDKRCGYHCVTLNPEIIFKVPEFRYCGYTTGDVFEYLEAYRKDKHIEFFGKMGLALSPVLINKARKDGQFRRFLWENHKAIASSGIQATVYAYKHNISVEEACRVCHIKNQLTSLVGHRIPNVKGTKIDRARLFNYIDSNNIAYAVYDDYLGCIKALGYDLKDTKNLYPNDFNVMHDIRSQEYASWKAKQDRKKRRKLYSDFRRVARLFIEYETMGDKYSLIIPREVSDLVVEGEKLNHCVGRLGYDKKMIEGRSLIAFCRMSDDVTKPFATVEYDLKSNKIRQFYAEHNSKPPADAVTFVNEWAEALKKSRMENADATCSN